MDETAAALEHLAALVEAAPSVREALLEWPSRIQGSTFEGCARRIARCVSLGVPLGTAVLPLGSIDGCGPVAAAIVAHSRNGGSLSSTLRVLATGAEQRARLSHDARLASAASKLSGRLLAGLAGIAALVMLAAPGASIRTMAASAVLAVPLAGAGTASMRKLQPHPPFADHPVATRIDLLAALLSAGTQLPAALELCMTADGELAEELNHIRRSVALGAGWIDALDRASDDGLRRLGRCLRSTYRAGSPAADGLCQLASTLREEETRACELESRRAPVLLVLPLTLCFLPAFGLLMIAPLLHALTG